MNEPTPERPGLNELRELHRKLGGLLDDPQPGFFTWRTALSENLMEMACFAGHGNVASFPKLLEALKGLVAIINDSQGVAGYHLNGNVAEWDEFEAVDATRAAIADAEKPND